MNDGLFIYAAAAAIYGTNQRRVSPSDVKREVNKLSPDAVRHYETRLNKFYFIFYIAPNNVLNVVWHTVLIYLFQKLIFERGRNSGCQANPLTSVFIDERLTIYGILFRLVV